MQRRLGFGGVVAACVAVAMVQAGEARACPIKHNDLAVVLGISGGAPVTVRVSLREGSASEVEPPRWSGDAVLEHGGKRVAIGAIDPKRTVRDEISRLIAASRTEAAQLPGFAAARRLQSRNCGEHPERRCGRAVLDAGRQELKIGGAEVSTSSLSFEPRVVTGVVEYVAGGRRFAVVNVGQGDPRFSSTIEVCDGGCRVFTTLHHGEQADVVVDMAQ
ncbi:MAG: hypothetical protein ACTHU0_07135 [Kofleriaceae bacterium]